MAYQSNTKRASWRLSCSLSFAKLLPGTTNQSKIYSHVLSLAQSLSPFLASSVKILFELIGKIRNIFSIEHEPVVLKRVEVCNTVWWGRTHLPTQIKQCSNSYLGSVVGVTEVLFSHLQDSAPSNHREALILCSRNTYLILVLLHCKVFVRSSEAEVEVHDLKVM